MKIHEDIRKASTLDGTFYNSPERFEDSKEKLFERSWQIIGESDLVKLPQAAYPFEFMEGFITEPLLLTRDKEDVMHCMSNVCTHRGNILVSNPCILNGGISCSYHGRRFGLDGCFKAMPETEGMIDFPAERDNLSRLDLKQWKQFLFTSLDPKIDFDEMIGEMQKRVGWMPVENFIFDGNRSREYLVKANWALYCDNYLEGFHIPYIHRDLAKTLDADGYQSEIYKYSNLQLGISKGGEMAFDLPKDSPDFGKRVGAYYFWLFPNIMFNFYPWGLSLNIIRPLQHNLTKVIFRSYVWDQSKLDSGAGALLDRVEREDEAIVENVQKGISSRLYGKGRYSPKMEQGVHHFHRLISDFMVEK